MTAQLRIEKLLDAPIERVYDAWTDPQILSQWYCPNPEWELKVDADVRVGGEYTVTMGDLVVVGTFTALERPNTIAFTWRWVALDSPASNVRVDLAEVEGKTSLVLTHTDLVDQEDADNHGQGWEGCLVRLPAVL
jgi:uncharacterized protein YndB with AHSA1/START domain